MATHETTRPAPAPRRAGSAGVGLAVLLSLVALGGSGYLFYRYQRDAGVRTAELDSLRAENRRLDGQVADLERALATGSAGQRELERKLADAAETNRSVREELLGLGERARLVEDAVSNLAEQSLGGATALKLNEAEFLLRMGAERLRLFGDVDGTLEAFRLADSQFADIDDPILSGVRQTLASEIESLAAAPRTDWNAAMTTLDALADASPAWPMRAAPLLVRNDDPDATVGEKLGDVLSRFVRIRRVDDGSDALVNPLNADAARASALLEIELAKSALAARDSARANAALERARQRVHGAFDPADEQVRDALATLETLRTNIAPVAAPAVGASLDALVNLRKTQTVRATAPARAENTAPADPNAAPAVPAEPNAAPDAPVDPSPAPNAPVDPNAAPNAPVDPNAAPAPPATEPAQPESAGDTPPGERT